MNVRKMRQIGKDILAEPRRFNMGLWAQPIKNRIQAEVAGHAVSAIPPCGTALCFAGTWGIRYGGVPLQDLVNHPHACVNGMSVSTATCADLNLPNKNLFYSLRWPEEVQPPPRVKPGTRRYAEHFVHVVLESYIRTNGWTRP